MQIAVALAQLAQEVEYARPVRADPLAVDPGDRQLPDVEAGVGMLREPAQHGEQTIELGVGGACQPVEVPAER